MPDALLLLRDRFHNPPASVVDHGAPPDAPPVGTAMLIRDERIAAIGSERAVSAAASALKTPPETINLDGRTVVPGLVDSHCHLDAIGMAMRLIDLTGTQSKAECLQCVAVRVATAADLDAVAPHNPVMLGQFDGHGAWVNTRAMRDSGVSVSTPNVQGGPIARDKPSGMFFEKAIRLIQTPHARWSASIGRS